MSIIDTGLPDGTEDFVGSKAKELENLRSSLLDKFYKDGCELVIPSLIEYTESIGGVANNSLKDYTYSFSDETAKAISIRPDISQQIARIDIQEGVKNKKKYCYFGETLRKTKDSLTKSRIAYKAGVELFGNINSSDEIEIIKLLISIIKSTGKYKITLSLGRTEPLSELMGALDIPGNEVKILKKIMSSKSETDLEEFFLSRKFNKKLFLEFKSLMSLNGKNESLKFLKKHKRKAFRDAAIKLGKVIKSLPKFIDYHLDFSDFPGFDYHSGLVFSIHVKGFGFSLAKGGQYNAGHQSAKRDAIGFDINVSSLLKLNNQE